MKKFLLKLLLFTLLFLASAAVLVLGDFFLIGPQNMGAYTGALIDKAAAMQRSQEPKILLIGNSNVSFGVQSQRIAEAMGMDVVNMGLHGELGNAFHENMVKLGLNPGDIVVICHSDYGDDGKILTPSLGWLTVETHREFLPLIPGASRWDMAKAYPGYLYASVVRKALGSRWNVPEENTSYSRSAFNEYGDIVYRPEDPYTIGPEDVQLPQISDTCMDRLNRLNQYVLSQGAAMVVAGYPIAETEFTPSAEEYEAVEQTLREKLDCPVISHLADYRFPRELFYNTALHLTVEGAALRSDQLIQDLQSWLQYS